MAITSLALIAGGFYSLACVSNWGIKYWIAIFLSTLLLSLFKYLTRVI